MYRAEGIPDHIDAVAMICLPQVRECGSLSEVFVVTVCLQVNMLGH